MNFIKVEFKHKSGAIFKVQICGPDICGLARDYPRLDMNSPQAQPVLQNFLSDLYSGNITSIDGKPADVVVRFGVKDGRDSVSKVLDLWYGIYVSRLNKAGVSPQLVSTDTPLQRVERAARLNAQQSRK